MTWWMWLLAVGACLLLASRLGKGIALKERNEDEYLQHLGLRKVDPSDPPTDRVEMKPCVCDCGCQRGLPATSTESLCRGCQCDRHAPAKKKPTTT